MRLVIISPAFEAPAVVAGFDDVTVIGQAGQQCLRDARGDASIAEACTGALDWAS